MDPVLQWIITGVVTGAVIPLATLLWKVYGDLADTRVKLAIAETKLTLYGAEAPELAGMVLELSERMDEEFGQSPPTRPRPRREVWPMSSPARRTRSMGMRRERP